MSIRIETVDLPGIGVRHDLVTTSGRRVSVIAHREGDRSLAVFAEDDPDSCTDTIALRDDEAAALAEVLGTTIMASHLSKLTDGATGLYTERVELPLDSPYLNATLGDTKARTRTHTSVVAIVRDGAVVPSPTPAEPLYANDVLVAVGTRTGLDHLARLLSHGPD